jgi:hypothetical protein
MRYIVEIEPAKELNDFSMLSDFVTWYLNNIADMKGKLRSVSVRRCLE